MIAALIAIAIGLSLAATAYGVSASEQQLKNEEEQLGIAQEQQDLAGEQFELEQQNSLIGMESTLLDMKGAQVDLESQLATTGIQIEETQGKIGDYQDFLSNFGAYEQYQKDVATQQGKSQFEGLLSNFNAANVMAAAKGQKTGGTSAGAVIGKTQEGLEAYAGEDLAFGTTGGGLFAQGYQQMVNDLNTQEESAERQLDIYSRSLESLYGSQESLTTSIDEYGTEIDELEAEIDLFEESIV